MTEPSTEAVEAAAETMALQLDGDIEDWLPYMPAALQAAYPVIEADIRAKIAADIEAHYLGPDYGRRYDGRESVNADLHHAYDEGLELAARIARGEASA